MDSFKKIFLWLLISSTCCSVAFSSSIIIPSDSGICARSVGLGKAYVALSDDSSAIFFNPAGLAAITKSQIGSLKTNLVGEISHSVFIWVFPYEGNIFGLGWANSSISAIPLTNWTFVSGIPRPNIYGYTDYGANVYVASYGTRLDKIFGIDKLKNVCFGTSFKCFTQNFSEVFPSFEGGSGAGIDLDIGIKFRTFEWMDMGLTLSNCLPKNFGGAFVWKKNQITENIPSNIKLGSAIKIFGENSFSKIKNFDMLWLFDLEKEIDNNLNYVLLHTGIECKIVNILYLRIGLDQQNVAQNNLIFPQTNLTYGAGINLFNINFDYAYYSNSVTTDNNAHFVSLKATF